MTISRRFLIPVGVTIWATFLLAFGNAHAVDQASLKAAHNPYQQTLQKYRELVKSGAITSTPSNTASRTPYIVGGIEAKPNTYPWMTALLVAQIPNAYYGQFCGGSLVKPDVVVTAAHCLDFIRDEASIDVAVGAYNLLDVTPEQRIKVRGFVIHPGFDPATLDNDIGIIKLEHPVDNALLPMIDPAQMAQLASGELLTAIGFGALNDVTYDFPTILQEVQLAYVDHAVCNDVMSVVGGITDTQICAGFPGQIQDSCYGDSGGPLMANINGEWRLTGIVSWGLGCGLPDYYGVYTEAADFVQWVNDVSSSLYIAGQTSFGYTSLGREKVEHRRVDNWSEQAITINRVLIDNPSVGFAIKNNQCGEVTLAPGDTCDITLGFEPNQQGRVHAMLAISGSQGERAQSRLVGAGLGEINASRALDSSDLDWYSGPDVNWYQVQLSDAVNGAAMRAGSIGDLENTAMLTYVNGPGTIDFNWKVSSEQDYDFLYLVVDGYIVDGISGDSGWVANSYEIQGEGEHSIMWVYDKDEYVSDLMDSAWLDYVVWSSSGNGNAAELRSTGKSSAANSEGAGNISWILLSLLLITTLRRRIYNR